MKHIQVNIWWSNGQFKDDLKGLSKWVYADSNKSDDDNGCSSVEAPPHDVDLGVATAVTLGILLEVSAGMAATYDGKGTSKIETCSSRAQ